MGSNPVYKDNVTLLAKEMGNRNMEIIFGGGNIGLMRIIADEMLKQNCPVIGVMPHFLVKKEIAHQKVTEMILVDTMNDRKQTMMDLSEAFVAMPGGLGTLDELSEVITGFQLNIINKPLALFNINNYFKSFLDFLNTMSSEGFLRPEHRNNIIVEEDPVKLLDMLLQFKPIDVPHHWVKELIEKTNEWVHGMQTE